MSEQAPLSYVVIVNCPGCGRSSRTWNHQLVNGVECPHCMTVIKVHRDPTFSPMPRNGEEMPIAIALPAGSKPVGFEVPLGIYISLCCLSIFVVLPYGFDTSMLFQERFVADNAVGASANAAELTNELLETLIGVMKIIAIALFVQLSVIGYHVIMISKKMR